MNNEQNQHKDLSRREILKYGLYGGLAAGLSSSLWVSGCGRKRRGKGPNIILITPDTLRADYLGCYDHSNDTSPAIDKFAEDALLFEKCFSHAPETRASFSSMLSGFLPHETKVIENGVLHKDAKMLAEILAGQGYKTVAVIGNYVLRKSQGFEQGFMIYDDTMEERELVRQVPERVAEYTTNRAIELLKKFRKEDLFMWIHYQDPHGPYTPPAQYGKQFRDLNRRPHILKVNNTLTGRGGIPWHQRLWANRNLHYYVSQYEGEIRYMDEYINRLIEALKKFGLYDNSLIIFTSDHGESMGEHDYYFAHLDYLYNTLIHVPLIIRYGKELRGRRTDFVQHLDLVPTVLKLLGMELDEQYRGRDLLEGAATKRGIFSKMNSSIVEDRVKYSILFDGLKLIYTPFYKQYEFFNLKKDFEEVSDLISDEKYREQIEDLKRRMHRIAKEDFLQLGAIEEQRELTEEEIRKLKSLGYTR